MISITVHCNISCYQSDMVGDGVKILRPGYLDPHSSLHFEMMKESFLASEGLNYFQLYW